MTTFDREPGVQSDMELLEAVVGRHVARHLIEKCGSLADISRLGYAELSDVPGVGTTTAARLRAAFEIGRRAAQAPLRRGMRFQTSEDIFRAYSPRLSDLRQEVFVVVLLDARNKVIKDVEIARGSLTECVVHPREVFIPVLRESAHAIILIHNHPSGDPSPSVADLELTRRLVATAEVMGVRILDHIIIGSESYSSFMDRGLIKQQG